MLAYIIAVSLKKNQCSKMHWNSGSLCDPTPFFLDSAYSLGLGSLVRYPFGLRIGLENQGMSYAGFRFG